MDAIETAVAAILSTYGDPLRVALDHKIDHAKIQTAIKAAEPDSSEAYALSLLAQANPPKSTKTTD